MDNIDYYKILKCDKSDSIDTVRKNYRKLALKYHPDKNPDGEENFKKIAEAYEVLSDPKRRKQYDKTGIFIYDTINYRKDPMQTFRDVFQDMPDEVTEALKLMVQKVSSSNEYSLLKLVYNSMPNDTKNSMQTRAKMFAEINQIPDEFFNIIEPLWETN